MDYSLLVFKVSWGNFLKNNPNETLDLVKKHK
jgi:hypothetical protein